MQRAPDGFRPRPRRLRTSPSVDDGADVRLDQAAAVDVEVPNAVRQGCQPSGPFGAPKVTKRDGEDGLGEEISRISTSSSRRLPFFRLQGAQEVTTFSQTESPPRLRGTTWSSVSFPVDPQYWQRQPSRAKRARREILRFTARGTRTYWTSLITCGQRNVSLAERSGRGRS